MSLFLIILLFVVAFILILLEMLVIPGVGVVGILGLGLLAFDIYSIFDTYGSMWGWVGLGATFVASAVLIWYSLRSQTWRFFALSTQLKSKVNTIDDQKIHVGDQGRTISRLAPMGKASFGDEFYEVESIDGFQDPETLVVVAKIERSKIYVKSISTKP